MPILNIKKKKGNKKQKVMAINLTKGQRIEIGLQKVGVGLGWDPNEGTGFDFDLDACAFMLGESKKLPKDEFFVFYNIVFNNYFIHIFIYPL